jgi:hypothetical protein
MNRTNALLLMPWTHMLSADGKSVMPSDARGHERNNDGRLRQRSEQPPRTRGRRQTPNLRLKLCHGGRSGPPAESPRRRLDDAKLPL